MEVIREVWGVHGERERDVREMRVGKGDEGEKAE